jgi:hypothetical protein
MAQEIGHSGSLGSIAGGLAALPRGSLSHRARCAVPLRPMRGCRFQYRFLPKFSNPSFLFFPPTRIRSALSKSPAPSGFSLHCLGAMNSNKIFAPLGPRERRCKLHEKPPQGRCHDRCLRFGLPSACLSSPERSACSCRLAVQSSIHHRSRGAHLVISV